MIQMASLEVCVNETVLPVVTKCLSATFEFICFKKTSVNFCTLLLFSFVSLSFGRSLSKNK